MVRTPEAPEVFNALTNHPNLREQKSKGENTERERLISAMAAEALGYDGKGFSGTPLALYSPQPYPGMDIPSIKILAESRHYHPTDIGDLKSMMGELSTILVKSGIEVVEIPISEGDTGAIAWHSVKSGYEEEYLASVSAYQETYGPYSPVFLKEHQQKSISEKLK